jgi:GH24 family phage-related lysozyme (muramidase)
MVDGHMVELPGLTKRRAAESALFLTAIEPT